MHRFFLEPTAIRGDEVAFPQDISRQISRVLRMSPGDTVTVLDNSGWEYSVTLSAVSAANSEGRIVRRREGRGEPATRLTLCQAMIRPERFELALQKCAELGVSEYIPVVARRSAPRHKNVSANRRERWRRIIREAAEQSRRSRLPTLDDPRTLQDALELAPRPILIAWEGESRRSLKSELEIWRVAALNSGAASIFVGPEGGFDPGEIALARERGAQAIGLGNRILRSETAAVALTAIIMHELGELGGEL